LTSIIRVRQVIEWEELPIEQIIEGQTTLWDHSDPNLRSEIPLDNLATYPLIDEFGHELGVFTSRGTRIWRRCAYIDPDISPYGILVNLRQVHELFTSKEFMVGVEGGTAGKKGGDRGWFSGVSGVGDSRFCIFIKFRGPVFEPDLTVLL